MVSFSRKVTENILTVFSQTLFSVQRRRSPFTCTPWRSQVYFLSWALLLHVTSIFTNISTTIHNYPCTEVFPSDTVVINQMSAGLKKITNEWLCCQIKRNSSCLHSYSLSPLFESCIYLSAFYFYGI